ncbi:hypothetical protein QBC43DRAFT_177352, partial [Cladorrhinum sp. PSN259]
PSLIDFGLYRVNAAQLASKFQSSSSNNVVNISQLLRPRLPTYWGWVLSGVCDVYEQHGASKDEIIRCRRKFPPTQDLLTLMKQSMRDRLNQDNNTIGRNNNTERIIQDVVSSWNATLAGSNLTITLNGKQAGLAPRLRASARIGVLAILTDCVIPAILVRCLFCSLKLSILFLPGVILSTLAGTLAILSSKYGLHGFINNGEIWEVGIILVFFSAGFRVLFVG